MSASSRTVDDLPENIRRCRRARVPAAAGDPSFQLPLEEIERRHVLQVLAAARGNKAAAARTLGLHRKTLYRKLERYGME